MKKVHLICNAHLDPVWLWEWEEGAAEAISTFRVAAGFCEEFDGFIFNHNEVTLYKWVEEYEPALFKRIQELVKKGKWHIMGGWYLQPDCNMPSGESFVRQILVGKGYFKEKFGVEPTTAINFDPFGHTRGLVQILKKAGYDSYLFCRPDQNDCPLPSDDFTWVGYDGSEIMAHRSSEFYNSGYGQAHNKVKTWLENNSEKPVGLILWGIGNHGGGPSRVDLVNLKKLIKTAEGHEVIHSIPEEYFKDLKDSGSPMPRHEKDLNSWGPGCYTSQVRLKQKHRLLENEIYMLEKMMTGCALQGYLEYPSKEIHNIFCDLLVSEFHDILPGSSIQPVEETSIRLMDHALEMVSRLKARAFFALAGGQEKAGEGEIPILVYNPHPYNVKGIFECEFNLHDQNWKDEFSIPVVYRDGKEIPSQVEKELSNLNLDWRKRITFAAELQPGQMNRFDCKIKVVPQKPQPQLKAENGKITFNNGEMEAVINCSTGLIDEYKVKGCNYLKPNAFLPLVMEDSDDPWETVLRSFRNVAGEFRLMSAEEGTKFSGVRGRVLDSVRVIEEGDVRTVVETVFKYGDSFICQTYKLPRQGTEIQVQVRVHWNEKSKMLKLSLPTVFEDAKYLGQVAYGVGELPDNGREAVAQKWVSVVSEKAGSAVTCINEGVYGSDFSDGELRITLLRSPGYSAHPIFDRPVMAPDRYSSRIDQGERLFKFWFNAGKAEERLVKVDREALANNEKPFVLSFFPSGAGNKPKVPITLSDEAIQLTAFKKAEKSEDYIIRLFNPTGENRTSVIALPAVGMERKVVLGRYEIKTLRLNAAAKTLTETDLLENDIRKK